MTSHLFVALFLFGQAAPVEDASVEAAKAQQKRWNEFYSKVAADYEISRGTDRKAKLKLQPEAVLYWSNPLRPGETNGSVFVWTHEGRAELVGTIFSHLVRGKPDLKIIAHEFKSLSSEPLEG